MPVLSADRINVVLSLSFCPLGPVLLAITPFSPTSKVSDPNCMSTHHLLCMCVSRLASSAVLPFLISVFLPTTTPLYSYRIV